MRRTPLALLLASVSALSVLAPISPAWSQDKATSPVGEPLPTDPRIVTGVLPNGLAYKVMKHSNPPGRAAIWMHVSSGSLNETESQRGLAHYLEHMAFNGSENFPPGTVVPFFESLGLTFGRHQNAFTSFEQTTYQLQLPDNSAEKLEKGLVFMSDVLFRLKLLPSEIDEERQIIMEEKRTRLGAAQRLNDYTIERLAPGSLFGVRLPIGTEQTIMNVQKKDFDDYYGKWYTASNTTVMVVADLDPSGVVDQIKKQFSQGASKPKPVDQDPKVKAYDSVRAIVATDPEKRNAEVQIVRIEAARPPTVTVAELRRDWVDMLGSQAFNRRMDRKITDGGMPMLNAGASVSNMASALRMVAVSAQSDTPKWKDSLNAVALELQRARVHGFSQRELDDVRTRMLSGAEEAAKTESTTAANAVLARWNARVAAGSPIMSAEQNLELMRKVLAGITVKEVNEAFARNFDPTYVTFVFQGPTGGDAPTEAQLIEAGSKALAATPTAEAEAARAASLMDKLPTAGTVEQMSVHEGSGVWSGWLSNGVRVHHRFMDYRKNQVSVQITLAAGSIQETAATKGLSGAAGLGLEGGTSRLTSSQITDLMTGKKVRVRSMSRGDMVTMNISGDPADLESGFQLAHLALTDGRIEKPAFEQWVSRQRQFIDQRKLQPAGVAQEVLAETLYPKSEARLFPMEVDHLQKITIESAQQFLDTKVKTAPMEVAIVGDLPRERAVELASVYLGSLPKRERISEKTLDELRAIKRPAGPLKGEREVATKTQQAIVASGFFGPDVENVTDLRRLQMARQIMSTRMIKRVREEEQLAYSPGAQVTPGAEYPGYGMFMAFSPTDPAKASRFVEVLGEMYGEFAKNGPTAEEMETAKKQFANTMDEQMKEPQFWMQSMQATTYRGLKLDDVVSAPKAYQDMTAQEVRESFAKYYKPESTVTVKVTPKPEAAPAAGDAPKEGAK